MLAFYDQNPWIAAQVPGGVVEFVQMMAEMPEDALQEMMLGAEMMREAGAGGVQPGLADRGVMPGELPDEAVEVFWEADEGGGGDVDDVPHGQAGQQEGRAEEEEGDEEEDDDQDVAVSFTAYPSSSVSEC